MQKTAYLIQPDGMPKRTAIRRRIRSRGLTIERSSIIKLPRKIFLQIYPRKSYPEFSDKYWRVWMSRALKNDVEVGIITGNDAIRRFASLAGRKPDPLKCSPGTLRRDFGVHCARMIDGKCLHHKVIHRPLTKEEAAHNVRIAEQLLGT